MGGAVVVKDALPSYRLGLVTALAASGFTADEAVDRVEVCAWAAGHPTGSVLVTLREPDDFAVVDEIVRREPAMVVVGLVPGLDASRYRRALVAGALGAVAWEAAPDVVVRVLRSAIDGFTMVPAPTARALAHASAPIPDPTYQCPPRDAVWLASLARGLTVSQLAREVGYSERETYRLLRGVYSRIGARNRTEALVKASRLGLLDAEGAPA